MKKENRTKAVLLFGSILVLILTLLVELGSNFFYFRLEKSERGIAAVSEADIETEGFEKTDSGYQRLGQESGRFRINLHGAYVSKFGYAYDYEGLLDMQVTVRYQNGYGRTEENVFVDKNNASLRQSVINIGKKVEWIELYTDTPLLLEEGVGYVDLASLPLTVTGFSVDNTFNWNPVRMAFVFLAGMAALLLAAFKDFFGKKLEYAFLLISLLGGILMIFSFPSSKVGWDEEIHFRRAYELSLYPGGGEGSPEFVMTFNCGVETWSESLPSSREEKTEENAYLNQTCDPDGTGTAIQSGLDLYTPGYVVPALFLKAGRFLHMPYSLLYQFGRLGGLLLYVAVMALAIRILPAGKKILTMVGLMPTPMFLACCYSYDSTVTAFTALGFALLLREIMEKERQFAWKPYFAALGCLIWGILPKAVYAPLVLTGLLIPSSRFKGKREKWICRAGIIAVFLALMSTFVLPSLLSPGNYGDSRGGNVDVALQMKNILTNPFAYGGILFSNLWKSLPSYLCGDGIFRVLGHMGLAPFGSVILVYFWAVLLTDSAGIERPVLGRYQKISVLLLTAASAVLIWTAFYLTYTEPGASVIGGVQGRYFLPLLLPLGLLFGNRKVEIRIPDTRQNLLVAGVSGLIYFSTVWMKILV